MSIYLLARITSLWFVISPLIDSGYLSVGLEKSKSKLSLISQFLLSMRFILYSEFYYEIIFKINQIHLYYMTSLKSTSILEALHAKMLSSVAQDQLRNNLQFFSVKISVSSKKIVSFLLILF